MADYVESFEPEDRARVFHFVALVSRWECALKRSGFARPGSHGQAEAHWNQFADAVADDLGKLNAPEYVAARDYLLNHPPNRQCLEHGGIGWKRNPRRDNETDARYLFRTIRDVRNNLFHGGKYQGGPVKEFARDRLLLDSTIAVLEASVDLNTRIRMVFDEPV